MADQNPMRGDQAVALTVPTHHVAFLRQTFAACRDGLRDDMADHAGGLRDPERARREADAYGRLLAVLDNRVIVPDRDVLGTLDQLAHAIDDSNDYSRVVLEHRALCGMLGQLDASAAGRPGGRA